MRHVCGNCCKADMVRATRDIVAQFGGSTARVRAVLGWHCPACADVEFLDADGSNRFEAALDKLAEDQRLWLARTRKRLKLTQAHAAELFGGGVNAFSRYETGKTQPPLALIKLLKVLDKHPELLAEVRT